MADTLGIILQYLERNGFSKAASTLREEATKPKGDQISSPRDASDMDVLLMQKIQLEKAQSPPASEPPSLLGDSAPPQEITVSPFLNATEPSLQDLLIAQNSNPPNYIMPRTLSESAALNSKKSLSNSHWAFTKYANRGPAFESPQGSSSESQPLANNFGPSTVPLLNPILGSPEPDPDFPKLRPVRLRSLDKNAETSKSMENLFAVQDSRSSVDPSSGKYSSATDQGNLGGNLGGGEGSESCTVHMGPVVVGGSGVPQVIMTWILIANTNLNLNLNLNSNLIAGNPC